MSDTCTLSWQQRRRLARGVLRDYGIHCSSNSNNDTAVAFAPCMTLDTALQLAQSCDAAFVTCALGYADEDDENDAAGSDTTTCQRAHCHVCSNALAPLLYGAHCPCTCAQQEQRQHEQQHALCSEDVAHVVGAASWAALQQTSDTLPQRMCGVVTVSSWSSSRQRARIAAQLQLAAYLGLRAVLVPLPLCACDNSNSNNNSNNNDDDNGCCCVAVLCEAARVLRAFVRECTDAKVWVRCCANDVRQRGVFHVLRRAVVYGYSYNNNRRNERSSSSNNVTTAAAAAMTGACARGCHDYTIHEATLHDAHMRHEAVASLTPLLYFAMQPDNTAVTTTTTTMCDVTVSSSWLGEDVTVFALPSRLSSWLPQWRVRCGDAVYTSSCARDGNNDGDEEEVTADMCSTSDTSSVLLDSDKDTASKDDEDDDDVLCLPQLQSSVTARWGGSGDNVAAVTAIKAATATQLPLLVFIVELLRRRATPLLTLDAHNNNKDDGSEAATRTAAQCLVDDYALLAQLYATHVSDTTRDAFARSEDVLLLPLQPLTQPLPSGVYEVFERDRAKYDAYTTALQHYMTAWLRAPRQTHHHVAFAMPHTPASTSSSSGSDALYVTIIGVGRGPLVDACFVAAAAAAAASSTLSCGAQPLQLHITAYECNAMAAAYTRARWLHDASWRQHAAMCGHTLDVVVCDARCVDDVYATNGTAASLPSDNNAMTGSRVVLPWHVGVCDVVVSELLGSVGDNELSPECVDGFVAALRRVQRRRGMAHNAQLTCIPRSYTAWAAPLHSTRTEVCIAQAARRGLTVPATTTRTRPATRNNNDDDDDKGDNTHGNMCCRRADAYAALHESMYVSNVCRGVLLAPAQPCWSFTHPSPSSQCNNNDDNGEDNNDMTRSARLTFVVPVDGRCSAIVCFFSAVLYCSNSSDDDVAVTLSTEATQRTDGLYSWFPCVLALPPERVRDLADTLTLIRTTPPQQHAARIHDTSSSSSDEQQQQQVGAQPQHTRLTVQLRRRVAKETRRVWYAWGVRYADEVDADEADAAATTLMNDDGWAVAMAY